MFCWELFFYPFQNHSFKYMQLFKNLKTRILKSIIMWSTVGKKPPKPRGSLGPDEVNSYQAIAESWELPFINCPLLEVEQSFTCSYLEIKSQNCKFSSFKLISNHIIFFVSLHFLLFSLPFVLFLFTSHLIRNYLDSLKREIFGNPDVVMEYPLHEMHDSYPQESRARAYVENMNMRHFELLCLRCENRASRQMHCPYKLCRRSWGNRILAFSYYSSRFVLVAKRGVMVPGVPIVERGNWGWECDGLLSSSTT